MKKRKVKLFASIASLGLVVAVMGVGVWAATQQAVKVSSQVSFTATSVAADIKLSINNAATPKEGDADFANAAKYADDKEYDIVKEATLSYAMKGATGAEANQYAKSEEAKDQLYSEKAITATPDTVDPSINTYEYDTVNTDPIGYNEGRAQARRIAYFTNDYAKTLFNNRIYLNLQDKDEDGYLNVGAKVVYEFRIEALTSSAPIFYHIEANLFEQPIYTPDPVYDSGTGKYVAQDPVRIKDAFEVNIIDVGTVGEGGAIVSEGIAATTPVSAPDRTSTDVPTTTLSNWTGTDATNKTPTGEAAEKAVKPGETRVIQVVYTVKDMDGAETLYQGISYTMTSLQLGDIYIRLANNGANIDTLPNYNDNNSAEPFDKVVEWITPKEEKPEITPVSGGEG